MKNSFSERLEHALELRDLKQSELAEKTKISKSAISQYISGAFEPKQQNIYKMAEALRVNPAWLMGKEVGMDMPLIKETPSVYNAGDLIMIPIAGRISCGKGVLAIEEIEGYEPTPKDWLNGGEHFYLRAKGDSMTGARIFEGDLLLIRKQPEVENGEIAAVLIDDELLLKRVYRNNGQAVLQSENTNYPPILSPPAKVIIVGKLKMNVIKY